MRNDRRFTAAFAVLFALLLPGCGGGSGGSGDSGSGRATFTITWPSRSRLIPMASASVAVVIKDDAGTVVGQASIPRPAGADTVTHVFDPLPVGTLTVDAAAHPKPDGSGTAQAKKLSVPLDIRAGEDTPIRITLDSTITTMFVYPGPIRLVPTRGGVPGHSTGLTVVAQDSKFNYVLMSPSKVTWSSSDGGVASVGNPGTPGGSETFPNLVTTVTAGTTEGVATITVTDSESGKSATTTVNTLPAVYMTTATTSSIVTIDATDGGNRIYSSIGESNQTSAIGLDSQNRVYLGASTTLIRAINLYDFGLYASFPFSDPRAVAFDSMGRIYVAEAGQHRIVRMDDMNGAGYVSYGTFGSSTGQFSSPSGIAVDVTGRIYVADTGNNRLVRIEDMTGTGWTDLSFFNFEDLFSSPRSIVVTGSGEPYPVYITDSGNSRVVRIEGFDSMAPADTYGSFGSALGQFNTPIGIALDSSGRIYVADRFNSRVVQINDISGGGIVELPAFEGPLGVFVR